MDRARSGIEHEHEHEHEHEEERAQQLAAKKSSASERDEKEQTDPGRAPIHGEHDDEVTANGARAAAAPAPAPAPPAPAQPATSTAPSTPPAAAAPAPPAVPATPAYVSADAVGGKVRARGAIRATPVPTPAPEKKKAPAAAPNRSSIELDPELAAEVAAAMPYESTLITRNPLLDKDAAPQRTTAPRDDEDTNPGARRPRR